MKLWFKFAAAVLRPAERSREVSCMKMSLLIDQMTDKYLSGCPAGRLPAMFRQCFFNTLETTAEPLPDQTTFVITGDIPAMWLRDSSAQIHHYLPFAQDDPELQILIEGLIRRQIACIRIDPYANAFNKSADGKRYADDYPGQSLWVWERKYEIDSLCNPIHLAYHYYRATGRTSVFDDAFRQAVCVIMAQWQTEQHHAAQSPYYFQRSDCPPSDTLRNHGRGMPVNDIGMTWSGFRPSDDACLFNYHIPGNAFAVVVLKEAAELAEAVYHDACLQKQAVELAEAIEWGIRTYGIVRHPRFGRIYAYETDGFGHYNLMDDANVPSLLSLPYLGFCRRDDAVYQNTRRFILSEENPYFFKGKFAAGIGSPHTPDRYIWPISLIMQALTSEDDQEIKSLLETLIRTDAGTGFMHEGFHADDPARFTRSWFAWANSLFGELVCTLMTERPDLLKTIHE